MSRPNKIAGGKAPKQRENLRGPRQVVFVRMQARVRKQLHALLREGESETAAIERLIMAASPSKRLCV